MQLALLCCVISILISQGECSGLVSSWPDDAAGAVPFSISAGPLPVFAPVFAPAPRYLPTILPTEPLPRFGDPLRSFEATPPLYPGGPFIRVSYGIESVVAGELRRIAAQREREARRRRVRLEQQAIAQNLRGLQMERWALARSLGQIPADAPPPAAAPAALEFAQPATPLLLGPTGPERLGFIPGTNRIWWRQVIQARHDTAQEKFLQQRVAQLLAQRQSQRLQLRRLQLSQQLLAAPVNVASLSDPSAPAAASDSLSLLSLVPDALIEFDPDLEPFPPPTISGREAPSTGSVAADRAVAAATLGGLGLAAPGATLGLGLGLAPSAATAPGGAFGATVGAPAGPSADEGFSTDPDIAGPSGIGPGELAARLIFGNALAGESRVVSALVSPVTGNLIVNTALQQATTAGAGVPATTATQSQAISLPSLSSQFSVFPSSPSTSAALNSPLASASPSASVQASSISSGPSMSWSSRNTAGRMSRGVAGGPGVFGRSLGGYPSASRGNRAFGGRGGGGGSGGLGSGAEGASFGQGSGRGRGRGASGGLGFGGFGGSAQGGAFGRGGPGGFGRGFGGGGGFGRGGGRG